jgi:hypothetical protein
VASPRASELRNELMSEIRPSGTVSEDGRSATTTVDDGGRIVVRRGVYRSLRALYPRRVRVRRPCRSNSVVLSSAVPGLHREHRRGLGRSDTCPEGKSLAQIPRYSRGPPNRGRSSRTHAGSACRNCRPDCARRRRKELTRVTRRRRVRLQTPARARARPGSCSWSLEGSIGRNACRNGSRR